MPVELKHKAHWVVKVFNLEMNAAGENRLVQLIKLDEFCIYAFENAKLYKEKIKRWHGWQIQDRVFEPRQLILLFNLRLKIFWVNYGLSHLGLLRWCK